MAIYLRASFAYAQAPAPVHAAEVRYVRTSDWVKMMATLDYLSPQQKEKMAYSWGNRSTWSSYTSLFFTPEVSLYRESDEEFGDSGYKWRKEPFYVRRDFAAGKTSDILTLEGKTWLVEDSLVAPHWRIRNDLKEVAGYLCMNAVYTDTIKRQTIEAWFAMDIPSRAGPERFWGLPGLILEININDGALIIVADRISPREPTTQALSLPAKVKAKRISESDYREKLDKYIKAKIKAEEPFFWGIRY